MKLAKEIAAALESAGCLMLVTSAQIIDDKLDDIRDALVAITCIEGDKSPGSETRVEKIAHQALAMLSEEAE